MDPVKNLIQMVKERPAIWDKNCDEYRDKFAKDRAWIQIYRQMEPTYDTLQHMMKNQIGSQITKKWYNVRDSYKKSLKINYGIKRPRPYIYAEQLGFLDTLHEKTVTDTDEERDEMREDNPAINEVFVDIDEEVGGPKRFRVDEIHGRESERGNVDILTLLANIMSKEEDEDMSFFKSITPLVKGLSDETKLEFRIQVMKLIRKFKTREKVKIEHFTEEDSD